MTRIVAVHGNDDLYQQLGHADYVVIAAPLTPQTEGLFDERAFKAMKNSARLINIGRGPIVKTDDLVAALKEGDIAGAGLDVFEQEPLSADSPLLQLDNVVATPHMGSATHETREAMARCAVDNLLAALAGERPANLVNPGAWRG